MALDMKAKVSLGCSDYGKEQSLNPERSKKDKK